MFYFFVETYQTAKIMWCHVTNVVKRASIMVLQLS